MGSKPTYTEPSDYFPEEIRKEHGLGEYSGSSQGAASSGTMDTTEKRFESDIETFFLSPAGGYTHCDDTYDPKLGLYPDVLLRFIKEERLKGMPLSYGCCHFLGTEFEREVRDWYFLCGAGRFLTPGVTGKPRHAGLPENLFPSAVPSCLPAGILSICTLIECKSLPSSDKPPYGLLWTFVKCPQIPARARHLRLFDSLFS